MAPGRPPNISLAAAKNAFPTEQFRNEKCLCDRRRMRVLKCTKKARCLTSKSLVTDLPRIASSPHSTHTVYTLVCLPARPARVVLSLPPNLPTSPWPVFPNSPSEIDGQTDHEQLAWLIPRLMRSLVGGKLRVTMLTPDHTA